MSARPTSFFQLTEWLHLQASRLDPNQELEAMRKLLAHPACARETAKMLFWRLEPYELYQFASEKEVPGPLREKYALARHIEANLQNLPDEFVRESDLTERPPWPEGLARPIPAELWEITQEPGELRRDPAEVRELFRNNGIIQSIPDTYSQESWDQMPRFARLMGALLAARESLEFLCEYLKKEPIDFVEGGIGAQSELRANMAEYVLDWLNAYPLLNGKAQLPSFPRIGEMRQHFDDVVQLAMPDYEFEVPTDVEYAILAVFNLFNSFSPESKNHDLISFSQSFSCHRARNQGHKGDYLVEFWKRFLALCRESGFVG